MLKLCKRVNIDGGGQRREYRTSAAVPTGQLEDLSTAQLLAEFGVEACLDPWHASFF